MRFAVVILTSLVLVTKALAVEVSIRKMEYTDRVFHGTIDNKYAITIYLSYANDAPDHRFSHSVKGWYWYDNIKEKIPLVGVWDGDLTLYQFQTSRERDSVARFISKSGDYPAYWKILNEIKSKTNFLEKFVILRTEGAKKNSWTNSKKTLSLEIDENELMVKRTEEILEVENNEDVYTADLAQFTQYDRNFTFEEFRVEEGQLRILMSFDYGSRGHVQARCGAGSEKGFILLAYDDDMKLQSVKRELIESCNEMMYVEEETSQGRAHFYNIAVQDNPDRRLVVDRENVTIRAERWVR